MCIDGQLARDTAQLQAANATGEHVYQVDSSALPLAGGITVQPGESWSFQTWLRDFDPGGAPRTHFSDALTLTYP